MLISCVFSVSGWLQKLSFVKQPKKCHTISRSVGFKLLFLVDLGEMMSYHVNAMLWFHCHSVRLTSGLLA